MPTIKRGAKLTITPEERGAWIVPADQYGRGAYIEVSKVLLVEPGKLAKVRGE